MRVPAVLLLLALCAHSVAAQPLAVPDLPEPLTNNAVAGVVREGKLELFTFMGLMANKTWRDITNRAWMWREGDGAWRELPRVPVPSGRLASIAAPVAGKVYLFGGYTVDEKGGEVSTPEVFRFDPGDHSYTAVAPMPTPVDDTVALVYQDRYIYLISGWHNTANVALVQLYDTRTDSWRRATDYAGTPVFGHVGGIAGRRMVVGGGVKVLPTAKPGQKYARSNETWIGEIDPHDPAKIQWTETAFRTAQKHYRMAGSPVPVGENFYVMLGGTGNPYNYNGIGYDGVPSEPNETVLYGSPDAAGSDLFGGKGLVLTMDHRGFVAHRGYGYVIGGMRAQQRVTAGVQIVDLTHPMAMFRRRKP